MMHHPLQCHLCFGRLIFDPLAKISYTFESVSSARPFIENTKMRNSNVSEFVSHICRISVAIPCRSILTQLSDMPRCCQRPAFASPTHPCPADQRCKHWVFVSMNQWNLNRESSSCDIKTNWSVMCRSQYCDLEMLRVQCRRRTQQTHCTNTHHIPQSSSDVQRLKRCEEKADEETARGKTDVSNGSSVSGNAGGAAAAIGRNVGLLLHVDGVHGVRRTI